MQPITLTTVTEAFANNGYESTIIVEIAFNPIDFESNYLKNKYYIYELSFLIQINYQETIINDDPN